MAVDLQEPKLKVRDERAIRREMGKLKSNDGLIRAEDVVAAASKESSAMHSQFEWDDTIAGHHYRLAQARALIRRIVVTMPDDKTETAVPKYISLSTDRKKPGGGYRETSEVLSNEELLSQLEETAKKDIDGVLGRYEMLKDLCAKVRKAAGIKPRSQKMETVGPRKSR